MALYKLPTLIWDSGGLEGALRAINTHLQVGFLLLLNTACPKAPRAARRLALACSPGSPRTHSCAVLAHARAGSACSAALRHATAAAVRSAEQVFGISAVQQALADQGFSGKVGE